MLTSRRLWRLFARWVPVILWMAAIYWMSAQAVVPHPGRRVGIADDITDYGAHIVTFGLLTVLAWWAFRELPLSWPGQGQMPALWGAGVFAALYAVTDELHQYWVPGRMATLRDWLADLVGILLAAALIAWYQAASHKRRVVDGSS